MRNETTKHKAENAQSADQNEWNIGNNKNVTFVSPFSGLVTPIFRLNSAETLEIRKPPIYKAPAIQLAYSCPKPTVKQTKGLPIGTQVRFIKAAKVSADRGQPLNTLLSVRWVSLAEYDNSNHLYSMPTTERISYLVELIRKWINARCKNGFSYIWVRELVTELNEHWHIGLYLPRTERQNFVIYLEKLLGEPAREKTRSATQRTEGEFACSEWGSWHVACDARSEMRGYYIAAYLGKGEPSQRVFRGKLLNNTRKLVRGVEFGGSEKSGKYDANQGVILGSAAMTRRFDMARDLKKSISFTKSRSNDL